MKRFDPSFLGNLTADDKDLLDKLLDWIDAANEKYIPKFSMFLNEHEACLSEKVLESVKFDNFCFYGGYSGAKRKVLGLFPPYYEIKNDDFPLKPLAFAFRKTDTISHRDVLGTLMALNISRNSVGDIIISDGKVVIFLYKTVLALAKNEINKIGNVGVKAFDFSGEPEKTDDKFIELSGTVASLRADCVVSLACSISREKAAKLIKAGNSVFNYMTVDSPDFTVSEGDTFSVRGFGKFILDSVGGISRKNRYHITIKKYI